MSIERFMFDGNGIRPHQEGNVVFYAHHERVVNELVSRLEYAEQEIARLHAIISTSLKCECSDECKQEDSRCRK